MLRRSWVEINLDVLETNYAIYKSQLPSTQEIMAVVKADAYGHGEDKVAERLQRIGCKHFAVSNIEEAILLRKAGVRGQILILGYTPISSADELVKYDITQALLSEEYAERLKDKGIKVQFAIDTGMNRIGLDADNPDGCERIIREYAPWFDLTGLFTHLCVADTENEMEFTTEQIDKFKIVAERVKDLKLSYGYNRMLSNKGKVIIKGKPAQIVGRVCMDQMMVDVTGLDVNFEDEVVLLGDGYTADDMARDIGTIGYDVVTNISKRVQKIYY